MAPVTVPPVLINFRLNCYFHTMGDQNQKSVDWCISTCSSYATFTQQNYGTASIFALGVGVVALEYLINLVMHCCHKSPIQLAVLTTRIIHIYKCAKSTQNLKTYKFQWRWWNRSAKEPVEAKKILANSFYFELWRVNGYPYNYDSIPLVSKAFTNFTYRKFFKHVPNWYAKRE